MHRIQPLRDADVPETTGDRDAFARQRVSHTERSAERLDFF